MLFFVIFILTFKIDMIQVRVMAFCFTFIEKYITGYSNDSISVLECKLQ